MRAGDCIRFTGVQHTTCAAGVAYQAVRDSTGSGPHRLPCLAATIPGSSTVCPHFVAKTLEQQATDDAEMERVIAAVCGETPTCPTCGRALTKSVGARSTVLTCPTHGFVARACSHVGGRVEGKVPRD